MPYRKPSRRSLTFAAFTVAFAGLFAAAVLTRPTPVSAHGRAHATPAPDTNAYYTQEVLPIFQHNCFRCHGAPNHRGGLSMDTRASLLKGGRDGAVIVPGHPESSLLVTLIRHEGPANDPMPMPPHGDQISNADIATIATWIKAGALMPDPTPIQ